jgi:hypothetical protein
VIGSPSGWTGAGLGMEIAAGGQSDVPGHENQSVAARPAQPRRQRLLDGEHTGRLRKSAERASGGAAGTRRKEGRTERLPHRSSTCSSAGLAWPAPVVRRRRLSRWWARPLR